MNSIASKFEGLMRPTLDDLRSKLSELPDFSRQLPNFVTEPDQLPYGRNVIYSTDHLELIVINLPPMRRTAIHDHGQSNCCAIIVEGTMTNTTYDPVGPGEVEATEEQLIKPGQFLVSPKGHIHQMSNRTSERVLSLHAYSPPLSGMQNYTPVVRQLVFSDYCI